VSATKTIFAAVGLTAVLLSSGAARASAVTVHFGLQTRQHAYCAVSVPPGSNAIAVLNAAERRHCITGYRLQYWGSRAYVSAIDGVGGRWAQFENDKHEWYVQNFKADPGDRLVYVYERCVFTPGSYVCI